MITKTLTKALATVAVVGFTLSASAIALTDPNVVGIRDGNYDPGQDAPDVAQTIIDLPSTVGVNYIDPAGGFPGSYWSGAASSQSGTITYVGDATGLGNGASVPAGFDYVLAKYDGPQGGAVLFFLNGQAATLPTSDFPLWGD